MKQYKLLAFLLAGSLFGVQSLQAQGMIDGFMRGSGNGVVAISYSYEQYSDFWKGETLFNEPNLGTITTQSASVFASVGLLPNLDVVASLPYVTTNASAGYWATQSGLQDLAFSVKFRPYEYRLDNVGTFSAIIAGGVSTPASNYVPDAPIAIGHQFQSADARLVLGFVAPSGLFANVQGGYIRRGAVALDRGYSTNVPDAVDAVVRAGYAHSDFYVDGWFQNQTARGGTNIGDTGGERGISFPSNGISYSRVGLNGYVPIPSVSGFGVSVSGAYTLAGRNIGKSFRISGGIVYNLPNLW